MLSLFLLIINEKWLKRSISMKSKSSSKRFFSECEQMDTPLIQESPLFLTKKFRLFWNKNFWNERQKNFASHKNESRLLIELLMTLFSKNLLTFFFFSYTESKLLSPLGILKCFDKLGFSKLS